MAETLAAILLVTSSGRGKSVSFWWPPRPHILQRVSRARPDVAAYTAHNTDIQWRSAFSPDFLPLQQDKHPIYRPPAQDGSDPREFSGPEDTARAMEFARDDEDPYEWRAPAFLHKRSLSQARSQPRNSVSSGRSSPVVDRSFDRSFDHALRQRTYDEYNMPQKDGMIMPMILGYPASALAALLTPSYLCHQKFELVVDDLVFIGHPVRRDPDGSWPPVSSPDSLPDATEINPEPSNAAAEHSLDLFHVVFVLDRPDPSSASTGHLASYYDIVYRQIVFKLTAALYAEQGARSLVDNETEYLEDLKSKFLLRDEYQSTANMYKDPVDVFIRAALECSIAHAIHLTFEAIKSNAMVDFTVGTIRVQIQLPPSLDSMLHDDEDVDYPSDTEEEDSRPDHAGWHLPRFSPGKSLLLTEDDTELDIVEELGESGAFDPKLKQEMLEFLDTAQPNLTFKEILLLLDMDWETLWSKVRVLVAHRKAIIIDPIPPTLKVVYVPVAGSSLSSTTIREFDERFRLPRPTTILSADNNEDIPPLPIILSSISTQPRQTFATALSIQRERLPQWIHILKWLIRRRIVVRLHTRVRVRVPSKIKELVREQRRAAVEEKRLQRQQQLAVASMSTPLPGEKRGRTRTRGDVKVSWGDKVGASGGRTSLEAPSVGEEEEDDDEIDWHDEDDNNETSIIPNPRKATELQRFWLQAMTQDKSPRLTDLFLKLADYFDGITTEDEIMQNTSDTTFTVQQFRDVLIHFKDYLIVSMHP